MKYIIIGAVAGGASTAARLRRLDEHAEIIVFEKGEYISYANCGLPYYIGDVITDRNQLFVQTADAFTRRFNIDVRTRTEVTEIDPEKKIITAVHLTTGEVFTENYNKLVLSPGAEPIRPPLPGISDKAIFTLRNVHDTDMIKSYVQHNKVKKAVIIGAGFIGLEMAENFHRLGLHVTVIEMINQILAPVDFPIAALVQQHIRSKGVRLRLNTMVTGFTRDAEGLAVTFKNGDILRADMVLLSIGVRPDTRLAEKAGLTIGSARGIAVNEYLQTSDPDIYAVGDAIEFKNFITGRPMITYLAGPANKQGRICANNIVLGNSHAYHGSINTAIVQVFEMTIATAGMAAKHLKAANIPHIISTNHAGSHASYYPEAKRMSIQIAFSPSDGRLLGAQIAGYEGVDKRIDILSACIKMGRTIYDLEEFEQAYAPPYSSAKDPVNMAGFVAENILLKRLKVFYWHELAGLKPEDLLIDVRREEEFAAGNIPGAINIPLDEIRLRLREIPLGKNILIYCEAGLRGYLAQRILKQNGFVSVANLSGGYVSWKACAGESEIQKIIYEYELVTSNVLGSS
jgi:NADPH-dependent 2,4-dienoyl-CoA reductase/sulfur reductase-like enzyme/rhodanese-related sulfurtransferase